MRKWERVTKKENVWRNKEGETRGEYRLACRRRGKGRPVVEFERAEKERMKLVIVWPIKRRKANVTPARWNGKNKNRGWVQKSVKNCKKVDGHRKRLLP